MRTEQVKTEKSLSPEQIARLIYIYQQNDGVNDLRMLLRTQYAHRPADALNAVCILFSCLIAELAVNEEKALDKITLAMRELIASIRDGTPLPDHDPHPFGDN
jgi:hypothetical protein